MADYQKVADTIQHFSALPPEQMADHLADKNQDLHEAAPTLGPLVQQAALNGLNFLNSKLPRPATNFPGEDAPEPSKSAKNDFMNYHEIVSNPLKVLEHVKNGTLNAKHLETMQAVYPNLLQEMQKQVMSHATPKNIQKLNYATKLALAKFLNRPMDATMMPAVIAANQAVYAQPAALQAAGGPGRGPKAGSTLGGLSKLNLAQRTATRTEQEEEE